MQRIAAMHIIDTLVAAGAERVAVNIVNHLPRDKYIPYLCTTRSDGPLDALVAPHVIRLRLQRKSRFEFDAVRRLRKFIQANDIRILHAHSSALFIARLAAMGTRAAILWHAHYGRYALEDQRAYHYRVATSLIGGVITVNREMAEWCSRRLGVPARAVWYMPNPVSMEGDEISAAPSLPGTRDTRIICVANFRPEKDHFTLIRAMATVVRSVPSARLLLAGKTNDPAYKELVKREIFALGLENSISILGERHDISAILKECAIGVLSSASEGLPMSLLEYGAAGLPAIATDVGQCADVLDRGRVGILVPPGTADALAKAMVSLLESPEQRRALAKSFRTVIKKTYSAETVIGQIDQIYETVLGRPRSRGEHPARERDAITSQISS